MLGLFSRLRSVFRAEVNALLVSSDSSPKLIEQNVRDLESALAEALIGLAQVTSVAIRMRRAAENEKRRANAYEDSAVALITRGQSGLLTRAEADRLAEEALRLQSVAAGRYSQLSQEATQQEQLTAQLRAQVERLRRDVRRYKSERLTLQARAKTAGALKQISLARADSAGTLTALEQVHIKVTEEKTFAEAYGRLTETTSGSDPNHDAV